MSTIEGRRVEPAPGPEVDPFRYGWRFVAEKQADGQSRLKQVPLTLHDLLFPQEEDQEMHYPSHEEERFRLMEIIGDRVADDPMAKVLGDCRIRYDVPGLEPLGPDVALFSNLAKDWDGGTLEVAATGARPILVVEVTSPDTRKNDFGPKKDYHHRGGVPLYVIVDARPGPKGRRVKLHGFRHAVGGYEPLPLDDQGRLRVESLSIWLKVEGTRVVGLDGETGEPFGDYQERARARARAEAEARAQELSRRADQAKALAEAEIDNRMASQVRAETEMRLRVEAEARLADAQAQNESQSRLIASQARIIDLGDQVSEVVKARLVEAEARIRGLEAKLRRLKGEA